MVKEKKINKVQELTNTYNGKILHKYKYAPEEEWAYENDWTDKQVDAYDFGFDTGVRAYLNNSYPRKIIMQDAWDMHCILKRWEKTVLMGFDDGFAYGKMGTYIERSSVVFYKYVDKEIKSQ